MQSSPTPAPTSLAEQWSTQGFVSLPQILAPAELESLSLPLLAQGAQGGSRNLLQERWCAQLAQQLRQHPRMAPLIGAQSVAVQCTYFEKSADRNWLVALHQDLSIPVAEQVPVAGLRGWSTVSASMTTGWSPRVSTFSWCRSVAPHRPATAVSAPNR